MTHTYMESPIGGLRIHVVDDAVTAIDFGARPGDDDQASPVAAEAVRQLREYFAGERERFDLPLAARGTPFQHRVWDELVKIPHGSTASYGEIAARLGLGPVSSRAVGSANGANPIPVVVPCHRVIGANGTLTGYAGGLERKQTLLTLEQPGLF